MQIENVKVTVSNGTMEKSEIIEYINHIKRNNQGEKLYSLDLTVDGDYVDMKYAFTKIPFERIRRITGYLVGTTDRWNNAKRAEEHDRVKHG